jgi:hypothetical protein
MMVEVIDYKGGSLKDVSLLRGDYAVELDRAYGWS